MNQIWKLMEWDLRLKKAKRETMKGIEMLNHQET